MIALATLLACAFHVRAPARAPGLDAGIDGLPFPVEHPPRDSQRPYVIVDGARWLLDTGASLTTCDDDFARARGLPVTPTRSRSRGELGSVPLGRVVLEHVDVGGWRFRKLPCAVRDLSTTSSVPDDPAHPVQGILGANVLRHFALELGPREARLRRERVTVGGLPLRRESLLSPRLLVELRAAGALHLAVVDTGADRTYLPGEAGALVSRSQGIRRGTGGPPRLVEVLERRGALTLAGLSLGEATWIAREGTPLLGMDLLAGGEELVVDWRARRLVRTPAPPASE